MESSISKDSSRDIQIRLEHFLLDSIHNGLAHSWSPARCNWIKPYPEVTGYLLSYFSNDSILKPNLTFSVEKLISMQLEDGSWPSFFGNLKNGYTFDTVQILIGLLEQNWIEAENLRFSIARGLEFVSHQMRFGYPLSKSKETTNAFQMFGKKDWAHGITPINLKMAELFNLLLSKPHFFDFDVKSKLRITKLFSYFLPQIREAHPGAYQLEGNWALGSKSLVEKRLRKYFMPDINGFIPAFGNVLYSYNSGSAQIAILWAKSGNTNHAIRILSYLLDLLEPWNDTYLCLPQYSGQNRPHDEYSTWGVKYTCELLRLMREIA